MTPEQREELKQAALAVDDPKQRGFDTRCKFVAYAEPSAILSLIAQVEAQATEREKLLNIIASAYQVAGKHDAPARVLDVLADPLAATEEQVEAMLPYQVEALTVPQWQPIETAPEDCILLLATEFFHKGDWRIKVGGYWNGGWDIFGASWTPSHWMAIPNPPAPTIPAIPGTKEGA